MRKDWFNMTREERLRALKDAAQAGQTITTMALNFDTSRGAISGALQRAGITLGRPPQSQSYKAVKSRQYREKKAGVVTTTFNAIARNPEKTKAREAKEARQRAATTEAAERAATKDQKPWEPLPGSRPRPMEELHLSRECNWPLWADNGVDENNQAVPDTQPHIFCGEPCVDRDYPYCKAHLRAAFVVLPPLLKPYEVTNEESAGNERDDVRQAAE